MAAELQIEAVGLTGKTIFFLLRNNVGQIWNGTSFVAYATVNFSTYVIAATEQGTASAYFTANMPAAVAGLYYVTAKQQLGGSAAETDTTIGTGPIEWDGTTVITAIGAFIEDIGNIQGAAPVHSLTTAMLKLVSKFDGKLGVVYKLDGVTPKMTQAVVTDSTLVPIRSLGVGA